MKQDKIQYLQLQSNQMIVSCPICKIKDEKYFLCKVNLVNQTEYDLIECSHCGLIYFNPMPTDEQLQRYYAPDYFNFNRYQDEAKGAQIAKRLMSIGERGKFLDIGCALGYFIYSIKQHSDWEVYGIEYSEEAVQFAREKLRLDVKQGELQDIGFPDQFFDYIHMNNVLEHVRNPFGLLREARRIIKNDGRLFLSVPNGYNDSRNLIHFYQTEYLPAKSPSGHIYFFQKRTLFTLFNQIGFKIEKKKTGSIKKGLRNIGYLPKKKNWKEDYYPAKSDDQNARSEIIVSEQKKYPDLYYRYRAFQSRFHDIPGLHNFGLDFIFILRPVIS